MYLDSIKSDTSKPIKMCVFDVETIGTYKEQIDEKQTLGIYGLGFYDGQDYTLIDEDIIENFVKKFLTKKYRGYTCFAHYGGKFDFQFLLDYLLAKNYKLKPLMIHGKLVSLKVYTTRKNKKGKEVQNQYWVFRDSSALLSASLDKLSKSFNVEVTKSTLDHSKMRWNNVLEHKEEWSKYLERDCISLYQVLKKFEENIINLCGVSLRKPITIASLSMMTFRKKFLKNPLVNYRNYENDIRKSYYGGRTEIFNMYGHNLHYYDVNSLYPYCMSEFDVPIGYPIETDNFIVGKDFGIVNIEFIPPSNLKYPLLPIRQNGKLLFTDLAGEGWYCSPEVEKAKQLGYKIKVIKGYKFERCNLFREYVDNFYNVKKNAKDEVQRTIAKLLLNSLYGKFGQKREVETYKFNPSSVLNLTPETLYEETGIYKEKIESRSKHILPAISSFITSYARLTLYKYIEQVAEQNGNVCYCDTDSLITDIAIPESKELGEMKDELDGQVISEGYFLLPKMYALQIGNEKYVKAKGFGKDVISFDQIKSAVLTGNTSSLTNEKYTFAGIRESMKRNKTYTSVVVRKRSVQTKYDKRLIQDDFSTIPLGFLLEKTKSI